MENLKSDDTSEKIEIKSNIFNQQDAFQDIINDPDNFPKQNRGLDDPEEYKHLKEICSAFFNYQVDSLRDVARMERDFSSIPEKHIKLLKYDYKERLEKLRKVIWKNYLFLLKIVSPYSHMFKFYKSENKEMLIEPLMVSNKDIIKMRSTLKLFIRDWTKEVRLLN